MDTSPEESLTRAERRRLNRGRELRQRKGKSTYPYSVKVPMALVVEEQDRIKEEKRRSNIDL